ncbi:MAG: tetratricopeptide repeat protein [Marinilabiliales bacterium]|nr:tetratricopeptide repeat protein [Marinilabiliales bacterium]
MQKLIQLKYAAEMMEAFGYLGYYHMMNENYSKSKDYYNRMINLDPNNKENKIKGYNGIGTVETQDLARKKKQLKEDLPYLHRAADAYNKILAIDPNNASAKSQLSYIQ